MKKILTGVFVMLATILLVIPTVAADQLDFKDVDPDHWARSAIEFTSEKGYINGYPDGTFRPSGMITRAEFTVILDRILALDRGEPVPFDDVEGHWASGSIQNAVSSGLIVVHEFGTEFVPNQPITRLEMAKMMARALTMEDEYAAYLDIFKGLYNTDLPFVDAHDMNEDDVPFLAMVFGTQIMNGYPNDSFGMDKPATRAEAATMLTSLSNKRTANPIGFQYLQELKEVAETGMNAEAVSELIPKMNPVEDEIIVEHKNFTAKLKRLYVLPLEGETVSMYERKFLPDRKELPARFFEDDISGYVAAELDVEFKKEHYLWDLITPTYLSPGGIYHNWIEKPEKYGYLQDDAYMGFRIYEGDKHNIIIHGHYGNNHFEVGLQTNDAISGGWYEILLNPNKGVK